MGHLHHMVNVSPYNITNKEQFMPNWCYNRVTAYGDHEKLKEIEKIFESKDPFNQIFPIPDFKNIPNEKGELPKT